jgi:hypothetical protein
MGFFKSVSVYEMEKRSFFLSQEDNAMTTQSNNVIKGTLAIVRNHKVL